MTGYTGRIGARSIPSHMPVETCSGPDCLTGVTETAGPCPSTVPIPGGNPGPSSIPRLIDEISGKSFPAVLPVGNIVGIAKRGRVGTDGVEAEAELSCSVTTTRTGGFVITGTRTFGA